MMFAPGNTSNRFLGFACKQNCHHLRPRHHSLDLLPLHGELVASLAQRRDSGGGGIIVDGIGGERNKEKRLKPSSRDHKAASSHPTERLSLSVLAKPSQGSGGLQCRFHRRSLNRVF